MPKPQLQNIEEHLQFLARERNPFTRSDHLEKPTFTFETLDTEFIWEIQKR
jgi:hypothetical protein